MPSIKQKVLQEGPVLTRELQLALIMPFTLEDIKEALKALGTLRHQEMMDLTYIFLTSMASHRGGGNYC